MSCKNAGCELRAGSDSVPTGSFTLTLTSLALTSVGDDAGRGIAHGSLSATMYVHTPPNTDCGAGESEALALIFLSERAELDRRRL